MNILSKYLESRGIKDASELREEERATFDGWKRALDQDDIQLKDISNLCELNINMIAKQFRDPDIQTEKLRGLVLLHSVYSSLKDLIEKPNTEREAVVSHLTSLL